MLSCDNSSNSQSVESIFYMQLKFTHQKYITAMTEDISACCDSFQFWKWKYEVDFLFPLTGHKSMLLCRPHHSREDTDPNPLPGANQSLVPWYRKEQHSTNDRAWYRRQQHRTEDSSIVQKTVNVSKIKYKLFCKPNYRL